MDIKWRVISNFIYKLERSIVICTMIIALTLVFINIILRYLFSENITWFSELATYLLVLSVYISISISIVENRIVRINLFETLFPKYKKYSRNLEKVIGLLVGGIFIFLGFKVIFFFNSISMKTPAMNIPYIIPYSIIIVSGILIALRYIEKLRER